MQVVVVIVIAAENISKIILRDVAELTVLERIKIRGLLRLLKPNRRGKGVGMQIILAVW